MEYEVLKHIVAIKEKGQNSAIRFSKGTIIDASVSGGLDKKSIEYQVKYKRLKEVSNKKMPKVSDKLMPKKKKEKKS